MIEVVGYNYRRTNKPRGYPTIIHFPQEHRWRCEKPPSDAEMLERMSRLGFYPPLVVNGIPIEEGVCEPIYWYVE